MILMDTRDNLTNDATDLIERAMQAGRDQMATVLANFLDSKDADAGADGYRDGIEDALNELIQAGATFTNR